MMMALAMKIHISASAKEALDAVGGYYTELRGTWNVNIVTQWLSFSIVEIWTWTSFQCWLFERDLVTRIIISV